jgi:hypothetical protein
MKIPLRSVAIALAVLGLHGTAAARQVPAPVVNPPVPRTSVTVSMAEFLTPGVTPPQAFAQALAAARQRQAARLTIPPGVYRMDALVGDFHLAVTDVQDLVIDGQGAEFVFTHPRGGVVIMNALRVAIRNLVVDYDLRLASPGVVQREADGTTTIRVDDAYPIDATTPVQAVTRYTHSTRSWAKARPEVYFPTSLTLRRAQTLQSPAFAAFEPGTEVIVRHYIYESAAFYQTLTATDITYEDLTIYGSPGMAFIAWASDRGLRIARCRIARRPLADRFVSAGSDGIHIAGTRGDIIIEDNDFSGQGDDSLNIHGLWLPVTAISGNTVAMRRAAHGLVQVGDIIRFVRPTDLAERWRATVVGLNSANGPDYVATLDAAPPATLAIGDLGGNVTRNNARFLVRHNVFHDHRARGMLIQAPLGVVEDNIIRDVTMQGMHLTTDAKYFFESTGLSDVIVRRNVITGVGYGSQEIDPHGPHMAAISLLGDVAAGIAPHPVHRNVVIAENTITDAPALAILVGSADGVTVEDNTIVHANQIPFAVLRTGTGIDAPAHGSIMVTRAVNVTVRNNHEVIAAGRPDRGVYVDVRNTGNVVVSGNTQQFGPTVSVPGPRVTSRGVPAVHPVVVDDVDTPSGALTLGAASSNPSLLPSSAIAFSGTGWDRRITLTPAAGQTGSADVTITASDGAATGAAVFTLTVVDGTALSAQVFGQAVRLDWTHPDSPGLQGFVLEAGFAPGAASISLPMGTARRFEAVVPSGVYYARVRAVVNGALGPASNEAMLSVGAAAPPAAPGNLLANVSAGQVRLAWHNAAIGGSRSGVRLEALAPDLTPLASIDLPPDAETFSTSAPAGTYLVRMRSVGPSSVSDVSNTVSLTVPSGCAIPAPPRQLSATASGSTVAIEWRLGDPGSAAPDGFVLEAGHAPGAPFVSLPLAGRTFHGTAPPGTYYVRVRAVSPCGTSAPGEERVLVVP